MTIEINSCQLMDTGLDYLLTHFTEPIFPRKISTKLTGNGQFAVYSKQEALARFYQANFLNCKIAAYPLYTGFGNTNRQAPDFIFIDLDLMRFKSKLALDKALYKTLTIIKDRLNGYPTVIWSGHGYHIYLPVKAFVLEEED